MRQIHGQKGEEAVGRKIREPLAEPSVGSHNSRRNWMGMNHNELVEYAKGFAHEKRVRGRAGLQAADSGLYTALWKRGLLHEVIPSLHRSWAWMDNCELLEYAKNYLKENGIGNQKELKRANGGLYQALLKRGLLREALPSSVPNYSRMDDEELVEHAKGLAKRDSVAGRKGFGKAHAGLYDALLRRGLVAAALPLPPGRKEQRKFRKMGDDELIRYGKEFLRENDVWTRTGLSGKDQSLYKTLARRGLLDRVFAEMEARRKDEVLGQLAEAVDLYTGGSG